MMRLPISALLILLIHASAFADDSRFLTLSLPYDIRVDVPRNWWVITGDLNKSLEAAGEAGANLAGYSIPAGTRVNLFRANSMPRSTFAGISITASDAELTRDELREATPDDLAQATASVKTMMTEVLEMNGRHLIEFDPIKVVEVDGHYGLLISYKKSGSQGPVIVRMTRLVVAEKEISFDLSYRESEKALWKPVVAYVEKSLRFQAHEADAGEGDNR